LETIEDDKTIDQEIKQNVATAAAR